jgi:hypothetical protein
LSKQKKKKLQAQRALKAQREMRRPKAGGFGEQLGMSARERGDAVLAKNMAYLTRKSGGPSSELVRKVASAHLRLKEDEPEAAPEENHSLFRDIDAAAAALKAKKARGLVQAYGDDGM